MTTTMRRWTNLEDRFVRANFKKLSHSEMAAKLRRSRSSVQSYCDKRGLVTRKFWTVAEIDFVRSHFKKIPAAAIAAKLKRSTTSVFQRAHKLGLSMFQKLRDKHANPTIRMRHGLGWSDSEIAVELGVTRKAIEKRRIKLGLPSNAYSQHRRDRVRARTRLQLDQAGVPTLAALRRRVFEQRAAAQGWPADLRPRSVQILNVLWDRGPMTRKEIAKAIGARIDFTGAHAIRKILKSNDSEGSYLAHLAARGLVIILPRACRVTGKGKGRSCHVYTLPLTIERRKVVQRDCA